MIGSTSNDFLNDQQREAVLSEERRILVLAGAGSEKTKTLLQKIIYLIEEKGVSPSSILAITFTKNAANEMIDRLILGVDKTGIYQSILSNKKINAKEKDRERQLWLRKYKWIAGLTIRTFHSFCYSVLRSYGVHEFDNKFRIIGDEKQKEDDEFLKYTAPETIYEATYKILIKSCEDDEYLLKLKRYILDYLIDKIHKIKPGTYASQDAKPFTSLNGTKVRSKSEQFIADWLYRHNIRFEYEPELNVSDFSFHPDFFLPDANIYIEHISNLSYPMDKKEKQFEKGKILYAKTYEDETKDSAYFQLTLEKIIRGRLPSDYEKHRTLNFQEEFKSYLAEIRNFIEQVNRVMDMIKVENLNMKTVQANAQKDQHERVRVFYELAIPLIEKYQAYCTDRSYLDFNDLVSRTISLFKSNKDISDYYQDKFQYILVDEFQDVNNLQVDLIQLLVTPQTQLFCVGDDWQSIYGFRGSNVSYIVEFEKHFPDSKVFKLNLNYRSTDHIVGASNEVIKHNKFRVDKEIMASKRSEHKIVIYAGNNEQDNIDFCVKTVNELLESGLKNEDILFLYRRTSMFRSSAALNIPSLSATFVKKGLSPQAKTIHAAKGLEAKVVFILGLTEGSGGFPDIWMYDRIFQVIKKTDRDLLLEEERRLFYVALTRAKDKLYLITERGNESSFLKEIPEIYTVKTS
ncbi:MAG TPA: UvrD-helicase domain-containing protein, partial [Chryseolinea sp.]|nr:UvrD-helicase domain-containing protein [Chryseolinea sp.]